MNASRKSPWRALLLLLLLLLLTVWCSGCAALKRCSVDPKAQRLVSELRGLPFLSPVGCRQETQTEIREYLHRAIERTNSAARLSYEGPVFELLGIIPPNYQYLKNLEEIYTDRIAGYYNTENDYYAMIRGVFATRREALIVHELTHALQDQHFDLEGVFAQKVPNDAALARLALIEGDAQIITKNTNRTLDCTQRPLNELYAQAMKQAQSGPRDPLALRLMADFPYLFGENFACALFKGSGQEGLNKAFRNFPLSTREILHPELYPQPSTSSLFSGSAENTSQGEILFSDSLGEFSIFALLATFISPEEAAQAAQGWIGDSLQLIGSGSKEPKTLSWQTEWENEAEGAQFAHSLTRAFGKRFLDSAEEIVQAQSIESCQGLELETKRLKLQICQRAKRVDTVMELTPQAQPGNS